MLPYFNEPLYSPTRFAAKNEFDTPYVIIIQQKMLQTDVDVLAYAVCRGYK